jgi:hypothetical protein
MDTATYVSHTIYADGVVEGKFRCPECYTINTHTITQDYYKQISSKRCCHNRSKLLCTANYFLPKVPCGITRDIYKDLKLLYNRTVDDKDKTV